MLWMWVLGGCAMLGMGGDLQADLNRLCRLATEVESDGDIPGEKRAKRFAKKVTTAKLGPGGRAMWKAIEAAPPRARLEVLDRLLSEQGVDDFQCPALRRVVVGE
jgi:hypothetical protein